VSEDSACSVTNASYGGVVTSSGFNTGPAGIAWQNGYQVAISNVGAAGSPPPSTCTTATSEALTATVSKLSDGSLVDTIQFVVSQPDQAEASLNPATYTISPTSAPATGGGSITVTASSGTPFAGATFVNFGPTPAAATVIGGGSAVTATIPAETSSQFQVFISVTTPTGVTFPRAIDQFTYGPTVTDVAPSTGPPVGGISVVISGSGFTATSTVKFGPTSATVTGFSGSTSLTVTEPAGSVGPVDVRVTNPALTANGTSPMSSADVFTYGLSVTSVAPTSGPATGGTTVTINGSGFTGVTGVTFEGVAATSVQFVSDGQITAVSPPGSGTVDIQVTTPAGQSPTGGGDKYVYTGGATTPVGLGIYLGGASNPTPTLSCSWSGTGANSCSLTNVGCGGSATFYVETVDGTGNPVAVTTATGVLVNKASPSGVTIPAGSFTTYASGQSVTAQLPTGVSCKKKAQTETVNLAATLNGSGVQLPITVSSS
jgi:large repetitive protein